MNVINWQDLVDGYNRFHQRRFKDIRELLKFLHARESSCERVGRVLGVCHTSVRTKMITLELARTERKGPRPEIFQRFMALPSSIRAKAPPGEVARRLRCSKPYVHYLRREKLKEAA